MGGFLTSATGAVSAWALPALQALQARPLDVICLGRVGVDLYAAQKDTPMEEVTQFNKSVGGSPANIATAIARLGGSSGVISTVANDGLGRYVIGFLKKNGVDTQGIQHHSGRALTSLALTEIRAEQCQVVIYRQNAADLQLSEADVDASYVASSKVLLLTGTAFSANPSREAAFKAISLARESGTQVVLDLDYRPYGWASELEAAQVLAQACGQCDMLIGNAEEFSILLRALPAPAHPRDLLNPVTQSVIVKNGAMGCQVFTESGAVHSQGIFRVQAQKPMGSGDAFAGALLWALCQGRAWPDALACGAANAAINVSRDTCAEAMSYLPELQSFMAQHQASPYETDQPRVGA